MSVIASYLMDYMLNKLQVERMQCMYLTYTLTVARNYIQLYTTDLKNFHNA